MIRSPTWLSLNFARSRIGRSIAFWVFVCIVLIEIVILIPSAMRFERDRVQELVTSERGKLEAAIKVADSSPETLSWGELAQLRGVAVYSLGGTLLYARGDISERPPDLGRLNQAPRYREGVIEVLWRFEHAGEVTLVDARLRAGDIAPALEAYILRVVGLVMLISVVVTVGALIVTHRLVLRPLRRVIEALRDNRRSHSKVALQWQRHDEFGLLIAEYNRLLDAQRSAERRVMVKQQHLEYMAHHDALTNMPNRLAFAEALHERFARNGRARMLLMMTDVDHFKRFNDQHGRRIGDAVLAEAGRRLQAFAGQCTGSLTARLEGDELVVMLSDVGTAQIEAFATSLRECIEAPYHIDGMCFEARVSVGLAYSPEHGCGAEVLLRHTRMALDEAKLRGRGRYWMFDDAVRQRITQRAQMEEDIKRALLEEQFRVHYQPKVDIRSRRIVGVEALVRWRHPEHGMVSPDAFIPLAEECGLVIPLGDWVLREACREARRWMDLGLPAMSVAVNISTVQMQSNRLLDTVSAALAESGLPAERLELEITESAVMEEPGKAVELLERLRQIGLQLAVDDFGTGYSALTYLKRFPVNTLKIDKAFVGDVTVDQDDAAIVSAVLELGRHFGLKVVAEGVENEAQFDFLALHGCDIAQGYYFSKPLSGDDFVSWMVELNGFESSDQQAG